MSIARQLFQLQEIDLQIDSSERTLNERMRLLSEDKELARAKADMESAQKSLEEIKKAQRTLEWEIDDISGKLKAIEEKLYSGRVGNPKELASLQHEAETFKANRSKLEDKGLEVMTSLEAATVKAETASAEFKKVAEESQERNRQLYAEIESIKLRLNELKSRKETFVATIEPASVEFYQKLRKQKGLAVARVEKGRCLGCRILLATTELQRARSGMVQCSSCGRILYIS